MAPSVGTLTTTSWLAGITAGQVYLALLCEADGPGLMESLEADGSSWPGSTYGQPEATAGTTCKRAIDEWQGSCGGLSSGETLLVGPALLSTGELSSHGGPVTEEPLSPGAHRRHGRPLTGNPPCRRTQPGDDPQRRCAYVELHPLLAVSGASRRADFIAYRCPCV